MLLDCAVVGRALSSLMPGRKERRPGRLLETNLFGPLRVVQAALPHLREQGSGGFTTVADRW
ncbi:hypothetical protein E1295_22425 [Nonomuraea mesophila]|uniref:Uncharacterized protein n=1 Tax=Nonomuraea mesophila TaxID=2530382 RepID=A0A4R5FDQ5_9ACTN|nr:hypothetical protein E1295_22425 [Nonomuraea mesophila]